MKNFVEKMIEDSKIITIAARPGVGKTSLMYHMASVLNNGTDKILINSVELSADNSMIKFLSLEEELPYYLVKEVESEKERLKVIYKTDYENVLFDEFKDVDSLSDYVKENNIKYIFLDYIQLMEMDKESYLNLYNLAKYEEATIFVLSQLPRKVEEREDKKPIISDLPEELVGYSDKVVMLSRISLEDNKVIAEVVNKKDDTNEITILNYNPKTGKFSI